MDYEKAWNHLKARVKARAEVPYTEQQYKIMSLTGYSGMNDVYLLMEKMERGEEIEPLSINGINIDLPDFDGPKCGPGGCT